MNDYNVMKYKPIHVGSLGFHFHWRYGVPYHTRTGVIINNGDVIDEVIYTVKEFNDGAIKTTIRLPMDESQRGEFCPKVHDAFNIQIRNYCHGRDIDLEFIAQRVQYSSQTVIVGFSSEIEKLKNLMPIRHQALVEFRVINDMATVDEYKLAVEQSCNNPGHHPMIFLGCLKMALGVTIEGIGEIENDHFIFVW